MDHRYVDIQTDLNLTKFEVSMSKWKPGCQTVLPSGHLPTVGVLAGHQCFTPKNQEIDHKINQKRWDVGHIQHICKPSKWLKLDGNF